MSISELTPLAEAGVPEAQTNLGICYMHGEGVERDPVTALSWYLKAAEQNEPSALANAGECYMHGIGTNKNIKKAIELLSKACEFDIPEALSSLGIIYITGDGVPVDSPKAFSLFLRAAEQQFPEALRNLGRCYLEGVGTEKNLVKALDCIDEARRHGEINETSYRYICSKIDIDELTALANNESASAQCFLGCMHLQGIGVPQNFDRAWDLIFAASRQSHPLALFLHGNLYYDNEDFIFAEMVYKKAVEMGSLEASHNLEMTRDKIAEVGTYFLVKVLDKKWADKFLDGDIFMRYLGYFGLFNRMMSRDPSINNTFRGDDMEGLSVSTGEPDPLEVSWIDGAYELRLEQNKIFCLYAIDVCNKNKRIAPIDPQIEEFGDTAIVILDSNEFLRRVHQAFTDKYGSAFWTSYKRVRYELDFSKSRSYTEFDKSVSYAWQREFRISLDLSEGHISKRTWDNMTDYLKLTHPWKVDNDENSDFNAESLTISIGDIRDICLEIPTSEFIKNIDKLIDEKHIPPAKVEILDAERKPYYGVWRPIMKNPPFRPEQK